MNSSFRLLDEENFRLIFEDLLLICFEAKVNVLNLIIIFVYESLQCRVYTFWGN